MTFEEVIQDKDFQALPGEEKRKVLSQVDKGFAELPFEEQTKVMGRVLGSPAPKTTNQLERFKPIVDTYSTKNRVDPNHIMNMIMAESSGDPTATSPKGAKGLMQLMPGTQKDLGVKNPDDPIQSVDGGTRYFRQMLDRFNNDYWLSTAAYNAGPETVAGWIDGKNPLPKETKGYLEKVFNTKWAEIRQGRPIREQLAHDVLRPLAEQGGWGAGAAFGAAGGVPSVGAGIGYSLGRRLADLMDYTLSVREMPSMEESARASTTDMAFGTGANKAMSMVAGAAAWPFKRFLSPYIDKLNAIPTAIRRELFEKHDIPYSIGDITQSADLLAFEKFLERRPGSQELMLDLREKSLSRLTGTAKELFFEANPPMDDIATGQMVKDVGELWTRKAKDAVNRKFMDVKDAMPEPKYALDLAKKKIYLDEGGIQTDNFRKAATQLVEEENLLPASMRNNNELMSLLKGAAKTDEKITWMEAQARFSRLNQLYSKENAALNTTNPGMKGLTTPEGRVYSILKKSLSEDMQQFAMSEGGPVWEMFQAANASHAEFKKLVGSQIFKTIMRVDPEYVASNIFQMGMDKIPPTTKLNTIREIWGADSEVMKSLQAKFLEMKVFNLSSKDQVSPGNIRRQLAQYGDDYLRQLGFNKNQISDLHEINMLSEVLWSLEKAVMNPSESGRSLIQAGVFGMLLRNPIKGIPAVMGPGVVAKLYLNENTRQWLMKGMKTPINTPQAITIYDKLNDGLADMARQTIKSTMPSFGRRLYEDYSQSR